MNLANAIASQWTTRYSSKSSGMLGVAIALANLLVNLDKKRVSFYDVNKAIFDGRKRGRKPRSAVKTLGTLTIKDFSLFWKRAKKAKSPFQPLDFVSRQNWLWESRLERVSEGGVSL